MSDEATCVDCGFERILNDRGQCAGCEEYARGQKCQAEHVANLKSTVSSATVAMNLAHHSLATLIGLRRVEHGDDALSQEAQQALESVRAWLESVGACVLTEKMVREMIGAQNEKT